VEIAAVALGQRAAVRLPALYNFGRKRAQLFEPPFRQRQLAMRVFEQAEIAVLPVTVAFAPDRATPKRRGQPFTTKGTKEARRKLLRAGGARFSSCLFVASWLIFLHTHFETGGRWVPAFAGDDNRVKLPDREGRGVMTPAELGQFVRETRREAGLTQEQLAGAAGTGVRFLIELEAGKPTAQLGKTLAVLAVLGCTVRIEPTPNIGAW